jgi:sugar/nucleoside kinase (ribokinase family)
MDRSAEPGPPPTIVVVGAASRDLTDDDPRGWRLGGGVSYGALTIARLGVRTAALIGVDRAAAGAAELDLLRDAGVDIRLAPLARGPVFVNEERPEGRRQISHSVSDEIDPGLIPPTWRTAPGWMLAPVAGEIGVAWADVPSEQAFVGLGWQGLLRELVAGQPVRRTPPAPNPLLRRADLVGLSRGDVEGDLGLDDLRQLTRPGGSLAVTHGDRGGLIVDGGVGEAARIRHYPAIRAEHAVDPTGAGDVFLAALTAARVEPRLVGGRIGQGFDLLLAAAAASLVLEGPGLFGVADRSAIRARMTIGRQRAGVPQPSSASPVGEPSG